MIISRGMRDKIGKYVDINSEICIEMCVDGSDIYDFCCFGVDKAGKLSDDRYMIFYNQVSSPHKEISFLSKNGSGEFRIHLSELPSEIDKLVFTANIDGNGTMGAIRRHSLSVSQNRNEVLSMEVPGSDFTAEKAIISIELYRKGEWRIAAVASGFNGGLSALLKKFGGVEADSDAAVSQDTLSASTGRNGSEVSIFQGTSQQQTNPGDSASEQMISEEKLEQRIMGKISLSKDKVNLKKHVVSLSKCVVNLSKKSGVSLGSIRAKVVVALDFSGSMYELYLQGTVQRTVNRLVPLGLTFDDNGSIDVYLFQDDYRKLADLNLTNYENYVNDVILESGYMMGGTQYAPVLRAIIEGGAYMEDGIWGFGGNVVTTEAIVDNEEPTFILFITDGENFDRAETDSIILKSSAMNVFIQFIGIGNENFQYLRELDDLRGRKRDHTGFSKMKSLDDADDNELYTNVLKQFSAWLKGLQ